MKILRNIKDWFRWDKGLSKRSEFQSEYLDEEILPEDINQDETERILNKVADEIVKRRLTVPAIFILESCRPLNFIGSQALIALEPFIQAIFSVNEYRKFALIIENDENIEKFIEIIETKNYNQKTSKISS